MDREIKEMDVVFRRRAGSIAAVLAAIACASSIGFGQTAAPSFDCRKATGAVEKLLCADPDLARLDRAMAGEYRKALVGPAAGKQRDLQRMWIRSRNDCAKSSDVRRCVEAAYQHRIAEIQIRAGLFPAPRAVGFDCGEGSGQLLASFYNNTDPPSALLKYGDDQVIAMIQPSGSGARYGIDDVDFWEHQGEAMVNWRGKKLTCRPR